MKQLELMCIAGKSLSGTIMLEYYLAASRNVKYSPTL